MRKTGARRHPAYVMVSASVAVAATLVSGCSGDAMRLSDGIYTSAVPVRPPAPVQSAFPGEQVPAAQAAAAPMPAPAGIDRNTTASIAPATVNRAPLAPPATAPSRQPVPAPAATPAPAAGSGEAGWTGTGGTHVTLRQGETLYNLTKRYGVPVDAIMKVNNISDPRAVQAGQRVLIPTYVYDRSVGVSAPDANAGVRSARSSVGGRAEAGPDTVPTPARRPQAGLAAATPAVATAPAGPAVAAVQGGRYTVQAGDTLSAISRRTGASVDAIKRTNGLESDMVRIGQSLIVPGLSGAPASPVQTASANADPVVTSTSAPTAPVRRVEAGSVTQLEQIETARAPEATGIPSMRWPVQGRIISAFGSNSGGRPNDGIDISVPQGTQVKAAENGVVIYAGDGLKEFGQTVLVRHSDGVVTVYGHLSAINVARGDTVQRGQTVGASGMSGNARQPQLHFEVRKDATPVDPVQYLN